MTQLASSFIGSYLKSGVADERGEICVKAVGALLSVKRYNLDIRALVLAIRCDSVCSGIRTRDACVNAVAFYFCVAIHMP